MKTNNRPMVKRIEYEVDCIREIIWTENKDIAYNSLTKSLTGNTREVERPMNDTEYIEYLEKELKLTKENLSGSIETLATVEQMLIKQQNQFLKIVEIVFNKVETNETFTFDYLLQEIKSAMEKGNNNG